LCRYGENPHQAAAFYVDESLAEAGKVGGWVGRMTAAAAAAADLALVTSEGIVCEIAVKGG
jgi:AICAR transformylase/IMP cyclohydrolase PurH